MFENVFGKSFTKGEADTKSAGLVLLVRTSEGSEVSKRLIENVRVIGFKICFLETNNIEVVRFI
jgi:hypothetical protein